MPTVILTFPGHFFQTVLCLRSILEFYPDCEGTITVIADDVQCDPWTDYAKDLARILAAVHPVEIVPVSTFPGIRDCVAGWWRQQLIKLTLDRILPDPAWFVVDGDVIFRSRCEVADCVPISRRYDATSRWSQMCVNYVRGVLGTDQGIMHDQDQPVITSPVPFRHLDRDLLQALRDHVESRFNGDFVDVHLGWFRDQTIVADIDPPTRWVMSEWELIECFRQMIQGRILPYHELGSGYQIDADLDSVHEHNGIFLHSYKRDVTIGDIWFRDQGIAVPDSVWQRARTWHDAREVQRLL
jgi:hypothetical protein